jgi:CheY-like chemotaxis protein
MHGGSVEARSEVGKGSEFLVHLPSIARRRQPRPVESSVSARGGGARRRVLLVEDIEDTAELTAEYLESVGYDVTVARDGPAALDAAASASPEIVLLDIGLPGMDGYEVARRLREDDAGGAAVLIALTGYGQEEDRKRSREAGFAHHLTKPFEPAELERLLAAIPRSEP